MYMADVSVAIRTYFSISSDEWSDGPLQLAARAITSGSREAYMSALRQFAKNSESSDTLEVALTKRICAIARRKRGRSAATGLVSALRVLEKLRLLPPSVLQLHWLQVEAIARITAPHAPPRPYGTAQHLEFLGRARIHWAWPRLFFLATCAVVFRMRSGDSESVSWEGITTPGWIEFFDEKRGKEWVQYPLSPFLEQSRKYVLSLKHPNTPPQSPVLPGGRNALRSDQPTPNDHDNGLCMQGCQGCRRETTLNREFKNAPKVEKNFRPPPPPPDPPPTPRGLVSRTELQDPPPPHANTHPIVHHITPPPPPPASIHTDTHHITPPRRPAPSPAPRSAF